MYVTCPSCYKVLSITTKHKNHFLMECPLCEGLFTINLNAIKMTKAGQVWITAPENNKRFSDDFYGED